MKKIFMCLILISCSTMEVSEEEVKDVYTDIMKSTEYKGGFGIKKDDVYVCDYGYVKYNDDNYRRFCDKDGKLINGYLEDGSGKKYLLRNGKVNYREYFVHRVDDDLFSYSFVSHDSVGSYSIKKFYNKISCGNNIIEESFNEDIYIYGKVKKNGVFIDDKLVFVQSKGNYFYKIGNERQMDGHFEIFDCKDNIFLTFTLSDGKYDGEFRGEYSSNMVGRDVKKIYDKGELLSVIEINEERRYLMNSNGDKFSYNKYEYMKEGDKYLYKVYLDDKLVYEGDLEF